MRGCVFVYAAELFKYWPDFHKKNATPAVEEHRYPA